MKTLDTTWRKMLTKAFKENKDDISEMKTTLTKDELDEEFYPGYGGPEGKPFTAWGRRFVYFPLCYDGAEWVGSAPRNPCKIETPHQGGG